jgi:hypothetical protein
MPAAKAKPTSATKCVQVAVCILQGKNTATHQKNYLSRIIGRYDDDREVNTKVHWFRNAHAAL